MRVKFGDVVPDEIKFQLRVVVQTKEIDSDLNRWGAGERFGHNPSDDEAAAHFISHPEGAAMLDVRHPELAID